MDPRNEISVQMDHFIGVDVGTGSARACIINDKGDIVGLASENIGLWQPQQGYYVCGHSYTHISLWIMAHVDCPIVLFLDLYHK